MDLATANGDSFNISIFLSQGDGALEDPVHYDLGGGPGSLVAPDLNGDGKLDLVAGTSNGVSVLLGRGDGTFGTPDTRDRRRDKHYFGGPSMERRLCVEAVTGFLLTKLGVDSVAVTR